MRINGVLGQLDEIRYPVDVDEVVVALDDPAIELAAGSQRLSDVFGCVDVDAVTSADEAKLVMLSGLESAAIGRKGYSDRDPPTSLERNQIALTF